MPNKLLSLDDAADQLRVLGVRTRQVLQVHAAFSKVGSLVGDPQGLIEVLRAALDDGGTLVMPSMTDDDDHPFDPRSTPCPSVGLTTDSLWRLPGVLRSDSPHAFAAVGPLAERIIAPHPLPPPHGPDCPVGRVHELGGYVLLLGVGHDANTTIHLAEHMAGVSYRRRKHITIMHDGALTCFEYEEIDHCCERFSLVDKWMGEPALQRRGIVGHAEARLVPARAVVDVVVERLRVDETAFLHPLGTDAECDDDWASLRQ